MFNAHLNRSARQMLTTLFPGTREFRSHLQVSSVSCDTSAPVVALISKTVLLFLPDSLSSPLSAAVDPLMTHVPATSLHEALLIRFPGGGGLDNTTAMLCCQVKSPISVQSFDAECDRVHVQWYRLITPSQRTPAIKIELTSLRCEHTPQLATSSQSSSSPSISSSSSSSSCPASSSVPLFQSASVPFKIFALCDGTMQVQNSISINKTSFLRCCRPGRSYPAFECAPKHTLTRFLCRCTTASAGTGTVLSSPSLPI